MKDGDEGYLGPTDGSRKEILERYELTPAQANIPADGLYAAALAREAQADEDKGVGGGTCSCGKAASASVTKARGNRDFNSKEPEPVVPTGRAPVPANPQGVPSSSPARSIRDGREATAAHQALAAAGSTDLGHAAVGGRHELAVSHREATSGLSAALKAIDAGRLAVQANGAPPLRGGKS
jgi:hypothetical protein